jgi:two-component sensor histidine kinase
MDPGPKSHEPEAGSSPALDETRRALRASREREALLRNELSHRVRNLLAITRSIFSRTVETAPTLEHAAHHFSGRLNALARYHGQSGDMREPGFDLEAMVYDELLDAGSAGDPRIDIDGAEARLDPHVAEVIGLALHELTTNSIKFGVLADTTGRGRLRISWSVANAVVEFEWTERGVPIVVPAPIPNGFGREFIEEALPYQLGAETRFAIIAGGLACRIRFPANGLSSGEQPLA